jgi:hypothetical protein
MTEITNVYKIFNGKPQNNIPVERYASRWEDNIKIDFTGRVDLE